MNFSVFECELNKTKMKKLIQKLEELIDKKKDSLRFYHLCENCVPKSFELCNREEIFEKREYFIKKRFANFFYSNLGLFG